jgi:hypothetical protein
MPHKRVPAARAAMIPPTTIVPNLVRRPEKREPINTDISDHLRPAARESPLKSKDGVVPLAHDS